MIIQKKEQAMEKYFVRFKKDKHYFRLPPGYNVTTFAEFPDHQEKRDVEKLIRKSLANPISSKPIKNSISPSDTIAVLIEDHTRYSPKRQVLKILLEELKTVPVTRENISIIIALGTHRELTQREMEDVYGEDLVNSYYFANHNSQAQDLVPVSKLKSGTVVKINRKVHEADHKIGIGSVFPHPINGYGGGGKIIFPGTANFDAILEHHLKLSFRQGSELGRLHGNPFYEDVCYLASKAGLNFIINSVLDHNDRLYDVVSGDPVKAHLTGAEICRGIISKEFKKKADMTIISSFPYTEGTQIMKPLAPASMITKEGGVIVLVADCTFPLPDVLVEGCERFRLEYGDNLREGIFRHFDDNRRLMEGTAPELNMAMTQALMAQDEFKVILVSQNIPKETGERIGFIFAEDMDQAFEKASAIVNNPDVNIVPSGGVILPMLE